MSRRLLLCLLILSGVFASPVTAREFRTIEAIATPVALPDGAQWLAEPRPIPRAEVERAVRAVADAWNSRSLDPLLGRDFASKSRLLDTIAEVVPRDARLEVLAVQAVSVLSQYRQADRIVSTVSAVVRSQIEFNDAVTGYQRLEGRGEWYFEVGESALANADSGRRVHVWDKDLLIDDHLGETGTDEEPRLTAAPGRPPVATTGAEGDRSDSGLPPDELMATATAPGTEPPEGWPSITMVRPDPLRADGIIHISGENFGNSTGVLQLIRREDRRAVPLNVLSWSAGYVTAAVGETRGHGRGGTSHYFPGESTPTLNVDEAKQRLFGDLGSTGPVEAALWLTSVHDYATEGVRTTGQSVVFERSPEIFRITSPMRMVDIEGGRALARELDLTLAVITPGSTALVRGVNFLSRQGLARLQLGARNIDATIVRWSDNEIELALPDSVEGLVGQVAGVSVTNHRGDVVRRENALYFHPRLLTDYALYEFELSCHSASRGNASVVLGRRLQNGWEIVEDAAINYQYYPMIFDERCRMYPVPDAGDDTTRHTVWCDCPPYQNASIRGYVSVRLRGPLGTAYHND